MEIRLEAVEGQLPPEETFVSVRVGEIQKQSRFAGSRTYKFPDPGETGGRFGRVEIFRRVGSLTVSFDHSEGVPQDIQVPCDLPNLRKLPMRLCVKGGSGGKVSLPPSLPAEKQSRAKKRMDEAQKYLGEFRLEEALAEAMREVIHSKPSDPYAFLSDLLRRKAAAGQEGAPVVPAEVAAAAVAEGQATMPEVPARQLPPPPVPEKLPPKGSPPTLPDVEEKLAPELEARRSPPTLPDVEEKPAPVQSLEAQVMKSAPPAPTQQSLVASCQDSAEAQELCRLTFKGVQFDSIDQDAFKSELVAEFGKLGVTLEKDRINLRPGSIIAEIRGTSSTMGALKTLPLSSIKVMGESPEATFLDTSAAQATNEAPPKTQPGGSPRLEGAAPAPPSAPLTPFRDYYSAHMVSSETTAGLQGLYAKFKPAEKPRPAQAPPPPFREYYSANMLGSETAGTLQNLHAKFSRPPVDEPQPARASRQPFREYYSANVVDFETTGALENLYTKFKPPDKPQPTQAPQQPFREYYATNLVGSETPGALEKLYAKFKRADEKPPPAQVPKQPFREYYSSNVVSCETSGAFQDLYTKFKPPDEPRPTPAPQQRFREYYRTNMVNSETAGALERLYTKFKPLEDRPQPTQAPRERFREYYSANVVNFETGGSFQDLYPKFAPPAEPAPVPAVAPQPSAPAPMRGEFGFMMLPSVGTWLCKPRPVSLAPGRHKFVHLPSVGTWLSTTLPAEADAPGGHKFVHLPSVGTRLSTTLPAEADAPGETASAAGPSTFVHLPSVGTWLCKRPAAIQSDAVPAPGETAGAAAPSTFVHLPSVGTWLCTRPAAIESDAAPTPGETASAPRPSPFVHLPSVGTWLSAKPQPSQADSAPAPGETAGVAGPSTFVHLPSVGTWLCTRPPPVQADAAPTPGPAVAAAAPAAASNVDGFMHLPSVGTWLCGLPRTVRAEAAEVEAPPGPERTVESGAPGGDFMHMPSVGTWLGARRMPPSAARQPSGAAACPEPSCSTVPGEGAPPAREEGPQVEFMHQPSVGTWLGQKPIELPVNNTPLLATFKGTGTLLKVKEEVLLETPKKDLVVAFRAEIEAKDKEINDLKRRLGQL